MKRVLLVDDHALVRSGFRRLFELTDEFEVVAEVSRGEQAYALLADMPVDLVVLDVSMPGMGGVETARRIRLRFPSVRCVMVSMHESGEIARRAMQAGAWGYVSKSSPADEILHAVREVSMGRRYVGAQIAQMLAIGDAIHPHACLTQREFEVLRMFAACHGDAEQIATNLKLSAKTVANHLTAIKAKLAVRNSAELMQRALKGDLTLHSDGGEA